MFVSVMMFDWMELVDVVFDDLHVQLIFRGSLTSLAHFRTNTTIFNRPHHCVCTCSAESQGRQEEASADRYVHLQCPVPVRGSVQCHFLWEVSNCKCCFFRFSPHVVPRIDFSLVLL